MSPPTIHITKSGKQYFVVSGRKIFIEPGVGQKTITKIYNSLRKKTKPRKKIAVNMNRASAVVNINQTAPRRRRRRLYAKRDSAFGNKPTTITTSSGNPKDSSNQDHINKLINENNKMVLEHKHVLDENKQLLLTNKVPTIDYSEQGRLAALDYDPDYNRIIQTPNKSFIDFQNLQNKLRDYGLPNYIRMHPPLSGYESGEVENLDTPESSPKNKMPVFLTPETYIVPDSSSFQTFPEPSVQEKGLSNEEYFDDLNEYKQQQPDIVFDLNTASISQLRKMAKIMKDDNYAVSTIPTNMNDEGKYRDKFANEIETLDRSYLNDVFAKANTARPRTIYREAQQIKIKKPTQREIDAEFNRVQAEVKRAKKKKRIGDVKGNGLDNTSDGLYDDQINEIMSKFKDYKGTIMRDEIKKLLPYIEPQSRLAFIINTDTRDKPGQHWNAVYIDGRNGPESSNSLEWFDSFGRSIPPDILEDCKLILKILKPETILKIKENRVVMQDDSTANCGYFCCRFLIDRFRGQSFSSATGYDEKMKINHIKGNEAEIERMKNEKPFNYISI